MFGPARITLDCLGPPQATGACQIFPPFPWSRHSHAPFFCEAVSIPGAPRDTPRAWPGCGSGLPARPGAARRRLPPRPWRRVAGGTAASATLASVAQRSQRHPLAEARRSAWLSRPADSRPLRRRRPCRAAALCAGLRARGSCGASLTQGPALLSSPGRGAGPLVTRPAPGGHVTADVRPRCRASSLHHVTRRPAHWLAAAT